MTDPSAPAVLTAEQEQRIAEIQRDAGVVCHCHDGHPLVRHSDVDELVGYISKLRATVTALRAERDAARSVAKAARWFCSELQEDSAGVSRDGFSPKDLADLNSAIDKWEAIDEEGARTIWIPPSPSAETASDTVPALELHKTDALTLALDALAKRAGISTEALVDAVREVSRPPSQSAATTEEEPRTRDESQRCGFRGCNKFTGHGGFHEVNAVYDLPKARET